MRHADLERIRNWRRRLLEFDAVPLADLLEEFSRYTPVPIRALELVVPPSTISLPVKILLFILINGWVLVSRALLNSYWS